MRPLKEYGFLLATVLSAVCLGAALSVAASHVSRDFFIYGKGIDEIRHPLWLGAGWSGVRWSFGPGALVGMLFLLANNPKPDRPSLPYSTLAKFLLWPLGGSILGAVVGAVFLKRPFGTVEGVPYGVGPDFMAAWGLLDCAYVGTLIGGILGALFIRVSRTGPRSS